MEIKNREYEDKNIKTPIPYFQGVLNKKHAMMTGEEITKTQISKHEMELRKESWELPAGDEE